MGKQLMEHIKLVVTFGGGIFTLDILDGKITIPADHRTLTTPQ